MISEKVTYIIPVYNGASHLTLSILSVIHQYYDNLEVLIVDDASKDSSLRILDLIKNVYPKVKIFSNKTNMGLPKSLNLLLENASGHFIFRHDQDDLSSLKRTIEQIRFLNKTKSDLVSSKCFVYDDSFRLTGIIGCNDQNHEKICNNYFNGIDMPHPSWACSNSFYNQNLYSPDSIRSEDQQLLLRNRNKKKYSVNKKILLYYNQQSPSLLKETQSRYSLCRDLIKILIREKKYIFLFIAFLFHLLKYIFFLILFLINSKSFFKKYNLDNKKIKTLDSDFVTLLNEIYKSI